MRVIPGLLSGFSIRWPFTGSATLKTVAFPWNACVLCITGSEFTITTVPTGNAWTWGSKLHFRFTISGFFAGFVSAFPFETPLRYTTASFTPLSGPTTISGSSRISPQVSWSLLGMIFFIGTDPW